MNYNLEDHFAYFCEELNLSKDERKRIILLIKETPHINWLDALGPSQIKSKKLLLDHLVHCLTDKTEVVSIGGWIGITEYLMEQKKLPRKRHLNLELDALAIEVAYKLNCYSKNFINLHYDALDFDYHIKNLVVINTSCEHLSHFSTWFDKIPQGTKCLLQSNNMYGLDQHVNCKETLSDFIISAPLKNLEEAVELDIGNNWKRFMIVGVK